jgi:hypothetical protein
LAGGADDEEEEEDEDEEDELEGILSFMLAF